MMVTSGGAGRSLYSFRDPNSFFAWSAAHAMRHHYGQLDVSDRLIVGTAVPTDGFLDNQPVDVWSWSKS